MVLAHNIWSGSVLAVVVTLIGWMALVKSLFFLFLPHEMEAGLFLGQLHYGQLFYVYAAISLARHLPDVWRVQVKRAFLMSGMLGWRRQVCDAANRMTQGFPTI